MLHRSEKGEAKKKSSPFSSLISMKKLCRCFVESMHAKMGCPSLGRSVRLTMCLLYAASLPLNFSFSQHCSFHITKNKWFSGAYPGGLKTR